MRMLWLKSDLLLPLNKGGRLRTWHLLRHLAKRHEISYLSFADPDQSADELAGMRDVTAYVEAIPRADAPKRSFRFYLDAARHIADSLPYAVAKYRSRSFAERVRALHAERRFDLLVCDFLFPAVNLPKDLDCPSVIFTHNVESEIWRRHTDTRTGLARRLYRTQYRRMLRYERSTLARFDGVLGVSEADGQTFERLYPRAIRGSMHVVPTGVDTEYFTHTSPSSPADSRSLVFTGSMDWLPNEDAMLYFCRDILPLIRREEPTVSLAIVGRAPTPAVAALAANAGITVTGNVPDIRPYVRDAAVYLVPLRVGGGTRLKIFEAMAMGKAVVSTTIGAEGLPVADQHELLVADEPQAFASAVLRLLRQVDERRRLEANARTFVAERYDWSAVARELDKALVDIASKANRISRKVA